MTVRCYSKPNRSKVRKFTENDLDRISRLVHEGGVPWFKILAVVAVSGGFGYLLCKALRLIDVVADLRRFLRGILDIGAAAGAIQAAILALRHGQGIPLLNRVVSVLLLVLGATLVFLRRLQRHQREVRDAGGIEGTRQFLTEACRSVQERVDSMVSRGDGSKVSEKDRNAFLGDIPDG